MSKTFNLPWDFGKTLYWKDKVNFCAVPILVISFTIGYRGILEIKGYETTSNGNIKMHKGVWGKSIFLTKEDAENQNLYKYNIGDRVQTTLLRMNQRLIGDVIDRNYNVYGNVTYDLRTHSGIKTFWEDENGKANLI